MRLRLLACTFLVAACSGSSSDPSSGGGPSCGGGDHALDPGQVEPTDTQLAVANGSVFYAHRGGVSGLLERIPLAGGDAETISTAEITALAASKSGVLAWSSVQPMGPQALQLRDVSGGVHPLPLPDGVSAVQRLAFDSAENLFVMSDIAIQGFGTGQAVWRWSAQRNAFDLLHKLPGGMGPFHPDGDGMSWEAASDSGTGTKLWHEDVAGGAPSAGIEIDSGDTIVGVDPQNVYVLDPGRRNIEFLGRTAGSGSSLAHGTALELPDPRPSTPSDVFADDAYFYWRAVDGDSGDATIWRAAKSGGSPESFAAAVEIEGVSIGTCTVAFLQKSESGGAWSIMTKSR